MNMTTDNNSKKAWSTPTIVDLDSKFSEMMTKGAGATTETTATLVTKPLITIMANS
jgi:hypothetical protein